MAEKKKGSLTLIAFIFMISNFLVKIMGLLRDMLLAGFYGTSMNTDAYIIANNIPSVLFAAIGASIATTFVPMYSRIKEEYNEERANSFTIHFIEIIIGTCIVLTLAGEAFTMQFVKIFASGFEGALLSLTVSFAKILFPSIFGMALMNVMGAYLQQHNTFRPIALVPIFGNGTIILALLLSKWLNNIYILVWGTLVGNIFQVLFYIPWVVKTGLLKRKNVSFREDEHIRKILILVVPIFIGEAANEINTIVDRSLVSGLGIGSVSAMNYAYKIINLVIGVFVASIGTVVFPKLSKEAAQRDYASLSKNASNAICLVAAVMLPVMVSVIIFRTEIVQILFERGNFNSTSTFMTSGALAWYSIGLLGMGAREILAKLFFSIQNTKIPMLNGFICAGTNIVLDLILIRFMGINGAAFATAIVAVISSLILARNALKKNLLSMTILRESFIKTFMSGVVLAGIELLFCMIINSTITEHLLNLGLKIIAGGLCCGVYFFAQSKMHNLKKL